MCVIVAKKFKDVGWVGAKNRDRNYVPTINITQSNRRDIQRLYIDDSESRYTEGLNEFGVCILSSALSVKKDEKEGDKASPSDNDVYFSPDGKSIRTALFEKSPRKALDVLINQKLKGCTLIFDQKDCFLLEGGEIDGEEDTYQYKAVQVKDEFVVRTNHGILLPTLGYASDFEGGIPRKSSEVRKSKVEKALAKINDPEMILEPLSIQDDQDTMMNPIRHGDWKKEEMMTTGQIVLEPWSRVLRYRPIHCDLNFKNTKLNVQGTKTYFEVVSSRKLLGFKEFMKSK